MSKLKRSRRSTIALLMILATGVSLTLFGGLSSQMARGEDPVLQAKVDRPIVHKKITVVKKVILPRKTIRVQAKSAAPSTSYAPAYTPASSSTSTSYSTPAPAPAPEPAPVVSSPS